MQLIKTRGTIKNSYKGKNVILFTLLDVCEMFSDLSEASYANAVPKSGERSSRHVRSGHDRVGQGRAGKHRIKNKQ